MSENKVPEFTKEEEEFLNKHFKKGEYTVMSVMVPLKEIKKFLEVLQEGGINCVALPNISNDMEMMKADTENPQ
jgi:tryptophan synthase alpha subunit